MNTPINNKCNFHRSVLPTECLDLSLQEPLSHVASLEETHQRNYGKAVFSDFFDVREEGEDLVFEDVISTHCKKYGCNGKLNANGVVLLCLLRVLPANLMTHQRTNGGLQTKWNLKNELNECEQNNIGGLSPETDHATHENDEFEDPPLGPEHDGIWDAKLQVLSHIFQSALVR